MIFFTVSTIYNDRNLAQFCSIHHRCISFGIKTTKIYDNQINHKAYADFDVTYTKYIQVTSLDEHESKWRLVFEESK